MLADVTIGVPTSCLHRVQQSCANIGPPTQVAISDVISMCLYYIFLYDNKLLFHRIFCLNISVLIQHTCQWLTHAGVYAQGRKMLLYFRQAYNLFPKHGIFPSYLTTNKPPPSSMINYILYGASLESFRQTRNDGDNVVSQSSCGNCHLRLRQQLHSSSK